MSSFSSKITYNIARRVRSDLAALGYKLDMQQAPSHAVFALHEVLQSGYADLETRSPTRFVAVVTSQRFNPAIRRDFNLGRVRLQKLEHAIQHLLDQHCATAWFLTTVYYVAFFAAIEMLRLTGTFVTFVNDSAAAKIRAFSPAPGHRLESGTYEGIATFRPVEGDIRIVYVKKNIRHHDYAWTKARELVAAACGNLSGVDAVIKSRLIGFLGPLSQPWGTPSATRNLWNYSDAGLFDTVGEERGKAFRKLVRHPTSAVQWAGGPNKHADEPNRASAIAVIAIFLSSTVDELATFVGE